MLSKKESIFFLLLHLLIHWCYSQDNYRIKSALLNNNKVEILLPPCSKIANEGIFGSKKTIKFKQTSKFRYHYIAIKEINKSYESTLKKIENSLYFYSKNGDLKHSIKRKFNINEGTVSSTPDHSLSFFHSDKFDCVVIKVDMQVLLNGSNISKNYISMARESLRLMCKKETDENNRNWPNGISQDIVEHVFDLIAVPNGVTMARYMHDPFSETSLILLNPKFLLKVEDTNKVRIVDGNLPKIYYEWESNRFISYGKDDLGNIIQNRITAFKNGQPNNLFEKRPNFNIYKIASFADIEGSEILKVQPYIALYTQVMKRNNLFKSSVGKYSVSADNKILKGNGFLIHLANTDIQDLRFESNFSDEGDYNRSVFGERNVIQPWIPVFNNFQNTLLPLLTKRSELTYLPSKAIVYRKYRSKYRKIISNGQDFFLLPNDHFSYKL